MKMKHSKKVIYKYFYQKISRNFKEGIDIKYLHITFKKYSVKLGQKIYKKYIAIKYSLKGNYFKYLYLELTYRIKEE